MRKAACPFVPYVLPRSCASRQLRRHTAYRDVGSYGLVAWNAHTLHEATRGERAYQSEADEGLNRQKASVPDESFN